MMPTLQNLWLVDTVEFDEETQKLNLRGVADRIVIPSGADLAYSAAVFFCVGGVHGEARLTLHYVDLSSGTVLFDRPLRVEGMPLETTDVTVRFKRIPVPHEGVYAWELYYGIEPLSTLRVEVQVN